MNDGRQLTEVLSAGLDASMFFDDTSRQIFANIMSADRDGRALTIGDHFAMAPNLSSELSTIASQAPVAQNVSYYAKEVVASAWQRQAREVLLQVSHAVMARKPYESTDAIRARALSAVDQITRGERRDDKGPKSIDSILDTVLPEIETQIARHKAGETGGISTGLKLLDNITGGGLKPGHYTIVAARPGIGKTALAVFMASMASRNGHRSLFFTVEMTKEEIVKRFLALEAKVAGGKIDLGDLTESDLDRIWSARKAMHGSLIDIDDSTGGSYEAFESACRRVKRQDGLALVVLDYLQLFTFGKHQGNRVGMLTDISNRLKRLALELKIAVIVVSQINREADRDGGSPSLHQLKDTGALEQDADLALLLYREMDTLFVSVAKNRRGKWGFAFPLKADLAINHFESVTP